MHTWMRFRRGWRTPVASRRISRLSYSPGAFRTTSASTSSSTTRKISSGPCGWHARTSGGIRLHRSPCQRRRAAHLAAMRGRHQHLLRRQGPRGVRGKLHQRQQSLPGHSSGCHRRRWLNVANRASAITAMSSTSAATSKPSSFIWRHQTTSSRNQMTSMRNQRHLQQRTSHPSTPMPP